METSKDYQRGYRHGLDNAKRDVFNALRLGQLKDEPLSDRKVREIYADAFGEFAADEAFGPDECATLV